MATTAPLTGLFLMNDAKLRHVMQHVMDMLAVRTTFCPDRAAALHAFQHSHFDCAFIDWEAADDPAAVIKGLRSSESNAKSFVTAMIHGPEEMSEAFRAGVNLTVYRPERYKDALRYVRPVYASMLRQRRVAFRQPVKLHMRVTGPEGVTKDATISDISETGIGFRSKLILNKHASIRVNFHIPDSAEHEISALARVLWRTDGGCVGARFTLLPLHQKAALENWIAEELKTLLRFQQKTGREDENFQAA